MIFLVLLMYYRHRFPTEIISYCVWLYYTFPLSYRDIEKMMLYRGIEVTYESIRKWCLKFGQQHANQLRRKRAYIADKWHLDEVVLTIYGSAILFVASSGCCGERVGCSAATTSRHVGSRAFFSQTAEETRLRATGDCHR